ERRRPATAAAHPRNLLRVLEPYYAMNVVEPMTLLHGHEPEEGPAAPRGSLALDVAVIYLHVILPDPLAARLPPIDVGWGAFARDRMFWGQGMQGRSTIFRSFVASLEKQERPGFHLLHIQLPHLPWHYLPSGRAYSPFGWFTPQGRYLRDPSWALDAWQRHLLQVGFVDLLLGELLERLEEIGLYDECLLVVTADHGISFWPGRHYRSLEEHNHPEDVLAVPLFIKLPNQRGGEVSRRNVESIDIAPTIADVIGLELPWKMDGCSVLDESCPERPTKLAFKPQAERPGFNQRLEFDPDVVLRPASLRRKLALFGSGSTPGALYRFGPFQQLVGRRVEDFGPIGEAQVQAVLDPMQRLFPIGDEDELVPVRVSGVIRLPSAVRQRVYVAVAVAGVIQTVVPAPRFGRSHRLAAMIPEEAVRDGRAEPALYLVTGSGDSPSLEALATERSGERSRWRW
ncbi:MAG: sulfatase-like hydrolase/transferase, partial [Deltaproteobacteria bacterium]|nr:sulfatase-like hydrolase/transferase [Deltaproteobacteria bacterium]